MIKSIFITLTSVLIAAVSFAAVKGSEVLESTTKKYRTAKLVEMTVEKTVKSELLGKETKYQGKISLANGKFRWENKTPDETLLVFDGSTIWSVQMPPKEFGGEPQIAKGKVDKKNRSNILISSLLGEEVTKNFKVVSEKKVGDVVRFEIEPLQKDLTIKSLKVVVDEKSKKLTEISYLDDIGNLTIMSFSKIEFKKKANNKLFNYQPPKGAAVSEL